MSQKYLYPELKNVSILAGVIELSPFSSIPDIVISSLEVQVIAIFETLIASKLINGITLMVVVFLFLELMI